MSGVFAEVEKLSTDHTGGRAASLTRGGRSGARALTTRHLDLSHGALDNPHGCCPFLLARPELLSQTVKVAPRALPFKWSSGLRRLVGSTLPQSHAALRKNRAGPQREPTWPMCLLPVEMPGLRQLGRLSPPTSEAKKDAHPDL